ncbi:MULTISPECIES: TIGR02530 family flagellar biosynthesis protein [unclassified Oceanobacillus]|uniref:TIGR02530 family flagellar biosynthesis protein n=1 Tax=unclassified Oceanobacillus TaxID=2630292 RepID=UPI001BE4EA82|nr:MULTISPECIES: TIGR02530 family flagellar biosynthesis protein [unclassified Oceanobacillus]MBT2598704.1 flagellar protein [Oceanobacillus sp. ISL-74]MBT2651623.1 flagellar protein [Oceanobacillus sp. ISL-73]
MDHRIYQTIPFVISPTKTSQSKQQSTVSFKDVLHEQNQLKISKHASERMHERNISIDDKQWDLIQGKMQEAKEKGVTDSLVVLNDATLVVSTKNNTVVTAMNRDEFASKIFTNINGTILIQD